MNFLSMHETCKLNHPFLAHLSWKLKWAFLSTCCPSSVCLSVNFSYFWLLLQNHWANFSQTWHKASLGVCSNEEPFNSHIISKWWVFSSLKQRYDIIMCLLIWTVFSGERCGPWSSCLLIPLKYFSEKKIWNKDLEWYCCIDKNVQFSQCLSAVIFGLSFFGNIYITKYKNIDCTRG